MGEIIVSPSAILQIKGIHIHKVLRAMLGISVCGSQAVTSVVNIVTVH